MSEASGLPDFLAIAREAHARAGDAGVAAILDRGRGWDLAPVLRSGGAVLFPHAGFATCGHQVAAAVHAALDSGADRVLALGVLHARTPELRAAFDRVAAGGDPADEPHRGVQGPGLGGGDAWRGEWSLTHFAFLWDVEARRRGITPPELVLRYPFLVGGRPADLPGIDELEVLARDAALVVTMDAFHHGIGYGTPAREAMAADAAGLDAAARSIRDGLALLRDGKPDDYTRHCAEHRSDGRDVGQVLHHLRGGLDASLRDLVADDTAAAYGEPPPTWVACALVAMEAGG